MSGYVRQEPPQIVLRRVLEQHGRSGGRPDFQSGRATRDPAQQRWVQWPSQCPAGLKTGLRAWRTTSGGLTNNGYRRRLAVRV